MEDRLRHQGAPRPHCAASLLRLSARDCCSRGASALVHWECRRQHVRVLPVSRFIWSQQGYKGRVCAGWRCHMQGALVRWCTCVDLLRRPQADFKFFGWKVPEEVASPSRSPSRSPVRSEYSD